MSKHNIYYSTLRSNREECERFEESIKKSIIPYEKFLDNSIKKLRSKEFSATFKKIGGEEIRLFPKDGNFYEVTPKEKIKLEYKEYPIGAFKIIKEKAKFNYTKGTSCKSKEIRLLTKIEEYSKEDKIIILEKENIEKRINEDPAYEKNLLSLVSLVLEDEEFGELEIKPLWLEKKNFKIESLKQDDEELVFKIINKKTVEVENLNINKPLYLNNKEIKYESIDTNSEEETEEQLKKYKFFKWGKKSYIFSNEKPNLKKYKVEKIIPSEIYKHLKFEDKKSLDFTSIISEKDLIFLVDKADKDKELFFEKDDLKIGFVIEKLSPSERTERFRIQLIEEQEDDSKAEIIGPSPLDYFFQDDAEIFDKEGRKYRILPGTAKSSEYSFVLSLKSEKKPIIPTCKKLHVKMNTYQLQTQKDALRVLKDKPLSSQHNLLKLFEGIKLVDWEDFEITNLEDEEYKVLTDKTKKGTLKQREFVNKALSTSDFMILEGPPGSGKTTAIVELIYQLTKQGKRILLSSSTHVAIDNVLERLKEKKMLTNIFPVRVGDKNKISEEIREFQIDEILANSKIKENLILESANLVCGTTIGILQHPIIKNNKMIKDKKMIKDDNKPKRKELRSIFSSFDYLIVDESSKTTFSEFLVPALYAKRWILVGDVNQLSPYTDREVVESHISLSFSNGKLNRKEIVLLLSILCSSNIKKFITTKKEDKFIVPIKENEEMFLLKEFVEKSSIGEVYPKNYLLISNNKLKSTSNMYVKSIKWFKLNAIKIEEYFQGIFVSIENLKEIQDYVPDEFKLLKQEKHNYSFNFNPKYKESLKEFKIKDRGKTKQGKEAIDSINQFFKEKTWESEVAWRKIRQYELKGLKKGNEKLEQEINKMMPKSLEEKELERLKNDIFSIEQVALPSILECLQRGISKKENYYLTTTLTEGFENIRKEKKIFKKRFSKLEYQYRMHREISKVPREIFYKEKALKDDEIDRNWEYNGYKKRIIWLDHKNHATGSYNKKEIEIIKKELDEFFKWSKSFDRKWEVAILSFYRAQERKLREMLRDYCSENSERTQKNKMSRFTLEDNGKEKINIKLYTVDKFQGQEADMVFLSMVNTRRTGFLDNSNRLNVAITRAKYQMVIVGHHSYYFKDVQEDLEIRKIAEKVHVERR